MEQKTPAVAPRWMSRTLWLAAVYNILWGSWTVLFPLSVFRLLDMPPPNYPPIWQCVGMIVGVYGVGYACAAGAPLRHWPIVLVGLLGKGVRTDRLSAGGVEGGSCRGVSAASTLPTT